MITNVPPAVDEMANLLLPVLLPTSHSKSDHDDQVKFSQTVFTEIPSEIPIDPIDSYQHNSF